MWYQRPAYVRSHDQNRSDSSQTLGSNVSRIPRIAAWVRRWYRHLPRRHLALVLVEVASLQRLGAEIRLRPSISSIDYRGYGLKCSEGKYTQSSPM